MWVFECGCIAVCRKIGVCVWGGEGAMGEYVKVLMWVFKCGCVYVCMCVCGG